jgi:hypothetical protein
MKTPRSMQISIPEPCVQAWDDMRPASIPSHRLKRMAAALLVLLGLSCNAMAQGQDNKQHTITHAAIAASPVPCAEDGQHEIYGTVIDERGNPVVNATVCVIESGIIKGSASADFDGNYSVRPLQVGRYDVKFSFVGYDTTITNVILADCRQQVPGAINMQRRESIKQGLRPKYFGIYIPCQGVGYLDPEHPGSSITHYDNTLPNGW